MDGRQHQLCSRCVPRHEGFAALGMTRCLAGMQEAATATAAQLTRRRVVCVTSGCARSGAGLPAGADLLLSYRQGNHGAARTALRSVLGQLQRWHSWRGVSRVRVKRQGHFGDAFTVMS